MADLGGNIFRWWIKIRHLSNNDSAPSAYQKNQKNGGSLTIVFADGRRKLKNYGWLFCNINRCKLSVKNAIVCLEYERL